MDPNACLKLIRRLMRTGNHNQAIRHADDLLGWLRHGGAVPSALGTYRPTAIRSVLSLRNESLRKGSIDAATRQA